MFNISSSSSSSHLAHRRFFITLFSVYLSHTVCRIFWKGKKGIAEDRRWRWVASLINWTQVGVEMLFGGDLMRNKEIIKMSFKRPNRLRAILVSSTLCVDRQSRRSLFPALFLPSSLIWGGFGADYFLVCFFISFLSSIRSEVWTLSCSSDENGIVQR